MWYNFIFINIYSLIIKKLQSFKDKGFVKSDIDLDINDEIEILIELELENLRLRFLYRLAQYLKIN